MQITKLNALAKALGMRPEEALNFKEDYLVYTNEEADKAVVESIQESLWAFRPEFLAEVTGFDQSIFMDIQNNERCESNNYAIRQLVGDNFNRLVEEAIKYDGRGHFLASYDGGEEEITRCGVTYYVYRQK